MKRLDEGKVSLVDFLRSIKFAHHTAAAQRSAGSTSFATLHPRVGRAATGNAEDSQLVRSAN